LEPPASRGAAWFQAACPRRPAPHPRRRRFPAAPAAGAAARRGAANGEGLGNAFLSHISAVDGIFHVTRAFDDPDVIHVRF
jgi:hypothetical protein